MVLKFLRWFWSCCSVLDSSVWRWIRWILSPGVKAERSRCFLLWLTNAVRWRMRIKAWGLSCCFSGRIHTQWKSHLFTRMETKVSFLLLLLFLFFSFSSGGQTPRRDLEKQLTGEEKWVQLQETMLLLNLDVSDSN